VTSRLGTGKFADIFLTENGCPEIVKKIITPLNAETVTVLCLFTFFNLILDAPCSFSSNRAVVPHLRDLRD
jgi:hypothetical protein